MDNAAAPIGRLLGETAAGCGDLRTRGPREIRLMDGASIGPVEFLFDRGDHPHPIGASLGVSGSIQFVGLLFRQVPAFLAVLMDEHSRNKIDVWFKEHSAYSRILRFSKFLIS